MNTIQTLAAPLGRLLLVGLFLAAGASKITGYAGTQQYMAAMGVPGALLPLVIALEIGGGLAILLGWQTRVAALLLAGFSLVSAVIFHANFADQIQQILFLKNVSIAGGLLLLVAHGPGAYSLDSRR